ncbi:MAG: UUP1 family membrane protein [Bdellovibrionales bacterium]|nr:UUP1 family membrane protein [Bdellovibrionales bacterium]
MRSRVTVKQPLSIIVPVAILLMSGIGLFYYRAVKLGVPLVPLTAPQSWKIGATVVFDTSGSSSSVSLVIPKTTARMQIVNERFASDGFSVATVEEGGLRRAAWYKRQAQGEQRLYYEAVVRRDDDVTRTRKPRLRTFELSDVETRAGRRLIRDLSANLPKGASLADALATEIREGESASRSTLFGSSKESERRVAELLENLFLLAKLPARMHRGLSLSESDRGVGLHYFVEVYEGDRWRVFDVSTGTWGSPGSYVRWGNGAGKLISGRGIRNESLVLSVTPFEEEGFQSHLPEHASLSPVLSLPLESQAVLRVLMIIPFAALLVVFLRCFVGFQTFGTFMPILIALAFRETHLVNGVLLFSTIVACALLARRYFARLQLLLVPRLAATLTVVIIIIVGISVVTHAYDIERGLSVALFPMVILTMVVERMSLLWEEVGAIAAVKQGVASLLVAALAYSVFVSPEIQYLAFVFPESLLVILALCILTGRYTGYRLSELRRFRALAVSRP